MNVSDGTIAWDVLQEIVHGTGSTFVLEFHVLIIDGNTTRDFVEVIGMFSNYRQYAWQYRSPSGIGCPCEDVRSLRPTLFKQQ